MSSSSPEPFAVSSVNGADRPAPQFSAHDCPKDFRVQGEDRVVGVGRHHPGGGEAAPQKGDDHQFGGQFGVAVDALGEPPEQRGVDGERRHRQRDRLAVSVVLAGDAGDEEKHARSDQRQVSPEREVAWLVEAEPPAPAGEVERDVACTIEVGERRRCHRFPSPGWLMLRIIRKTAAVGSGPVSDGPVATASTPRPSNTKAAITPPVCGPMTRAVAPCLP